MERIARTDVGKRIRVHNNDLRLYEIEMEDSMLEILVFRLRSWLLSLFVSGAVVDQPAVERESVEDLR